MGMVKSFQSSQNSTFAISKQYLKIKFKLNLIFFHAEFPKSLFQVAISLQYLKKEVRNGHHFWHADKRFCKLVLSFLMEVAIHVQNTQNRKLLIFLQYIRKNVTTA